MLTFEVLKKTFFTYNKYARVVLVEIYLFFEKIRKLELVEVVVDNLVRNTRLALFSL